MEMKVLVVLSVLSLGATMTQSQPGTAVPSDAVAEAIALGLRGSKFTPVSCRAFVSHGAGFAVEAMGPKNRIQSAALEARHKYLGFTPANVTDPMRAATLSISAMPLQEIAMPGATHIVLKSKPPTGQVPIVLQPLSYQIRPTGW